MADQRASHAHGLYEHVAVETPGEKLYACESAGQRIADVYDGYVEQSVAYRGTGCDESVVAVLRGIAYGHDKCLYPHGPIAGADLVDGRGVRQIFLHGAPDV